MSGKYWPLGESYGLVVADHIARADNPSIRPHIEYQKRPLDWIVDKLGVPRHTLAWSENAGYDRHVWDGTRDPLVRMLEAMADGQNVGVESGTGTGKTFTCAAAVLWWLACFPNAIAVTAAPKQDQLLLHLWKEIDRFWPAFKRQFPSATKVTGHVRMQGSNDWMAIAFVAGVDADEDSANRARGFHAPHLLIVTEETPGVHPAIMAAFRDTLTGEHNIQLAVGNPDHQHDGLHTFCQRADVVPIRISALDHPNVVCGSDVIPGAVGQRNLLSRAADYGEDSPRYKAKVRGISPEESTDALIRRVWVEQAIARQADPELRKGLRAIGVDVANSEAGDEAAIARGVGAVCEGVDSFPCPNASDLAQMVAKLMQDDGVLERRVGVDAVGVGASTINKFKELGRRVMALNGGERAIQVADEDWRYRERKEGDDLPSTIVKEEKYNNLRCQMWWQLRDDLVYGRIGLPADDELIRDLTTPTWEPKNGKIYVEEKRDQRKRLGRSPNKGDAAVYWNWVRQRRPEPKPKEAPPPDHDQQFDKVYAQLQKTLARQDRKLARATKLRRFRA